MTQTFFPQTTTSPAYVCEICQQDGNTCAHSLTLAPAAKITPVQKRLDFIAEVTKPVNDRAKAILTAKSVGMELTDLTEVEFIEIAEKMRAEGPAFGKTSRWKVACAWAALEIAEAKAKGTLDASLARWAVVQGSVWLCHAAD